MHSVPFIPVVNAGKKSGHYIAIMKSPHDKCNASNIVFAPGKKEIELHRVYWRDAGESFELDDGDAGIFHGLNLPACVVQLMVFDYIDKRSVVPPVFTMGGGLERFKSMYLEGETVCRVCDMSPKLTQLRIHGTDICMNRLARGPISEGSGHSLL